MTWPLGWPLCPSHGHQAAALATAWAELREATHLLTRACGWGDGAGIRLSRAGADARAPLQRQEASSAPCRSQHTQEDRLRQERMQLWKWFTGGLGTHVDLTPETRRDSSASPDGARFPSCLSGCCSSVHFAGSPNTPRGWRPWACPSPFSSGYLLSWGS